MNWLRRLYLLVLILLLVAVPALAQDSDDETSASQPSEQGEADESEAEEFTDTIVVTASRAEQRLQEVPAAMTVLSADDIEAIPADNYGDFLRNVPGMNVAQFSARDVQVTSRAATASLASQNLVLMDNRTIYLDFFGFVMWDLVPLDPQEIKQIEVVRGPGSAVWGANAMSGVINVITKRPREMQGTSITIGGGQWDTLYGSVNHAGAGEKLGYKIGVTYYQQDEPYDRPTGTIPGTESPINPEGTQYPDYENQGTKQPKVDLQFDYNTSDTTSWRFGGGWAETDGIMQTGIGPFDIEQGTSMSYLKGDWLHQAMQVTLYANILDGEASNLLTRGIDGQPLAFDFQSETYNLGFNDTRVLGTSHVITYGANARRNNFDLSIAPSGDNRDEYGVFLQDEILFGQKWSWLIGARWDDIDPIGSVVSPRTTLMFKPTSNHTLRASFNRAFKAPSMIHNYLDIIIINVIPLPTGPYPLPTAAKGNPALQEEQLDAFEVGWVGTFDDVNVSLAVYRNETTDSQDFFPAAAYDCFNPPPGWPLPPIVLCIPPPLGLEGQLTSLFTYRNIGEIIDQGVELGIRWTPSPTWSAFLNYSYQADPEVTGIEPVLLPSGELVEPINVPPTNRFNVGGSYNGRRFFATAVVNYQDEAFWTDVLNELFWGPTDAFTSVGVGAGVYLVGDRVTLSVNGTNVFDEEIEQHVFGDIIGQKWTGQVRFRF